MVWNEFQKIIRWTPSLEKVCSAAVLWKIIFSLGIAMRHPWRRTWLSLLGGGRELQKSGNWAPFSILQPEDLLMTTAAWRHWDSLLPSTRLKTLPCKYPPESQKAECSTAEWLHTLLCLGSSREGWSMWSVTGSAHPWAFHEHCTEAHLLEHLLDGCLKSTTN